MLWDNRAHSARDRRKMKYETACTYAGSMGSKTLDNLPHYKLRCQVCDEAFEDDGLILGCPTQHGPALLITEYKDKRFEPDTHTEGMFRYRKWLPGTRGLSGAGSSVTYKSEQLNRVIGLPD